MANTDLPVFDIRKHPPTCPVCKEKFTFRYQLQWHFQWKHRTEGNLIVCNECNGTFSSEFDIRWHRIIHGKVDKHVCEKCGYAFKTDLELRKHHLRHTWKRNPFNCENCLKTFPDKSSLDRHKESHAELIKKIESCVGCFTRQSFRTKHARNRLSDCMYITSVSKSVCSSGKPRAVSL